MPSDDPLAELVALLGRLPGIGERTATRLAYFVLAEDRAYASALAGSLGVLHDRVRRCASCGNFTSAERCRICSDPRRDGAVLCVVARVPDLVAIERAGSYRGRYHVLHALLAPLDGMSADRIDLDALSARVRADEVREVVLATPLSVEGEATALYVAQSLRPLGVKVSRIASGIPHGGELEFADQVTLGRAFEGRKDL
ncbi:MAG: recombination protein RecR [Deltaproteobacteria bacterium]|nr:recombination protein RecR [Deltaproteobacteria bacterium]